MLKLFLLRTDAENGRYGQQAVLNFTVVPYDVITGGFDPGEFQLKVELLRQAVLQVGHVDPASVRPEVGDGRL